MKNYILMLGVAGVAFGSYCAYADNEATMTVTATINHDVSLSVTQDLNIGTITINPASTREDHEIYYNLDGTVKHINGDAVTAATSLTPGIFTANIANPSACNTASASCGGLSVTEDVYGIFSGDSSESDQCYLVIVHDSANRFKVVPDSCYFRFSSSVVAGTHTKTITISYTAS
ncbi:MAG: hypothetical protein IJ529_03985 [Alphaproteobacteria bacterium]|nr:hypothetical protein [Alphaproteobacteria bacterium]MBR1600226.1 hypothetical protein [Alphaproteobacteria bacterium]